MYMKNEGDGLYSIQEFQIQKPKYNLRINKNFSVAVFEEIKWYHRLFVKLFLGWTYEKVID